MKALLIAEKPSLMRTIKAVYDKNKSAVGMDIDFTSQVGHLLRLKMPDEINPAYKKWNEDNYPMDIDFQYKTDPKTYETFKKIKDALKSGKYDCVINAGDPDQEGELLIRETLDYLHNRLPVYRFWSNDLTDGAVLNALKNLHDDKEYDSLYEAGLARQHADYKYGMNLTGLFTVKTGNLTRIGRVKGAIVRLLVDREREIKNFVPHSDYKHAFHYEGFDLIGETLFKAEEEAKTSFASSADITEVKEQDKSIKAPKLYKLSTAQTDAYKIFKMSAKDTLATIQSLYEKGFLSYPRTDCEYVSEQTDAKGILASVLSLYDVDSSVLQAVSDVVRDRTYFNNKAISEEGHTALIPTGRKPSSLTTDEQKIYDMVTRRFIAIFARPKVIHQIAVKAVSSDKENFSSTVSWDIEAGWEAILNPSYQKKEKPSLGNPRKEHVASPDWHVHEVKAKCPSRYTNGSLVAAMEHPAKVEGVTYKIGTPATRANIIEDCKKAGYYTESKGQYFATEFAENVIDNFGTLPLFSVKNTGEWEQKLIDVRNGVQNGPALEEAMDKDLDSQIDAVKRQTVKALEHTSSPNGSRTKGSPMAKGAIRKCPLCGGDIIENSKAFGCANWKTGCRMTIWKNFMGTKITKSDAEKLIAGKSIKKKVTSKAGKTWEQELYFNTDECKVDFKR